MVRFLHAADLHLGMRVTRFGKDVNGKVREARFQALDNLVARAVAERVDFVLIAGDLYDDNLVDASTCRRAPEVLASIARPTYVIPGNHDPLTPGAVWERPAWRGNVDSTVTVLRSNDPVRVVGEVWLFPCPLTARNSFEDPTRFIPPRAAGDESIRIGLAHGSLRDREGLPEDDHLIGRHVAEEKGLDYLALGHWHRQALYPDRAGVVRTAYAGVHEPMRFQGREDVVTGWQPYGPGGKLDVFDDDGVGRVLLVEIERAGAPPILTPLEVGKLRWLDETWQLSNEDDLGRLINDLARRPDSDRQLLRLHLEGVLTPQAMLRLDELDATLAGDHGGVLKRYLHGELDTERLHLEPDADELKTLVGTGLLKEVFDQLARDAEAADEWTRAVAREAQSVLIRMAKGSPR